MTCFLGHHPFHSFLSSSKFSCPPKLKPKPKPLKHFVTYATIPARDEVIDFGRYKGRMLGTLPSTYLKWVSNNLRARDFEEWANLAHQVLQDPVYNDRLEWEFAEKILNGDVLASNNRSEGSVADLLEISQRFGWDNEDKVGWSKVDFQLLGTSKGGRIPRVKEKEERKMVASKRAEAEEGDRKGEVKERRVERRERMKVKRRFRNMNVRSEDNVGDNDNEGRVNRETVQRSFNQTSEAYNPFPGREALLRKALSRKSVM